MGIAHCLHSIGSSIGLHIGRRHSVSLMPHIQIRGSVSPWSRVQQLGQRSHKQCRSTTASRLHVFASAAVAESAGRRSPAHLLLFTSLIVSLPASDQQLFSKGDEVWHVQIQHWVRGRRQAICCRHKRSSTLWMYHPSQTSLSPQTALRCYSSIGHPRCPPSARSRAQSSSLPASPFPPCMRLSLPISILAETCTVTRSCLKSCAQPRQLKSLLNYQMVLIRVCLHGAGLRIDAETNAGSRMGYYLGLSIVQMTDDLVLPAPKERTTPIVGYPEGLWINLVSWSQDGRHIAFTVRSPGESAVLAISHSGQQC